MKFGTAHGRSRPEFGSVKHIDVYGSRGVFRRSLVIAKYDQEIIANADLLGPLLSIELLFAYCL